MSLVGWGLGASWALAACGVLAGVCVPARPRAAVVGGCTAVSGVAAILAGVAGLGGDHWSARLPALLPLGGLTFDVDALSGLFLAVSGLVVTAAAVYAIGYAAPLRSRSAHAAFPCFAATLVLVPAAASVSTFLFCWELMALASLLLVVAEHQRRASVREAGVWYAVMTHLGLVVILCGLALLAAATHADGFAAVRAGADRLSAGTRDTVFALTLAGFASKAGMAPLHAWLPRAHPRAPSHVSALMSAAMVSLGVYGIVRVSFDLLGGGPAWWGLVVLGVGAFSAVYGILQAAVSSDLKRLLAYSTCENMGLVLVGVGAAELLEAAGQARMAALALAAALLHVVNHAAFKALAFLGAGSVQRATGTTDLDALGGLRSRMPATTAMFAIAALGAMALPPGNGFVGEWLLLKALIGGLLTPGTAALVTVPVAVAVIALCAGLATATFVKVLGVGFFARPRGDGARSARESPPSMLAGMGLLAGTCVALALAPAALGGGLSRAVAVAQRTGAHRLADGWITSTLSGMVASLNPLWWVAALAGGAVVIILASRLLARRPRRRQAPLWDCGAGAPTARMQYTATSFAEPLQRVFDDVLAPEQDVDVTPYRESAYLVERISFQRRVPDRVEHRLYTPILGALGRLATAGRALANGSVHRYLGYGFYGLVGALMLVAVVW